MYNCFFHARPHQTRISKPKLAKRYTYAQIIIVKLQVKADTS